MDITIKILKNVRVVHVWSGVDSRWGEKSALSPFLVAVVMIRQTTL